MISRGRPSRWLRRMRRRTWTPGAMMGFGLGAMALVVLGCSILLLVIAARARGANVKPGEDVFWKAPDYAKIAPASIALLPAVSFDRNLESERLVGESWAVNFSKGSYRWLSPMTSKVLLSSNASADSLSGLARANVLKNGRVDSLLAPALCGKLRVQAVLSVLIEQWDRQVIEPDQSGKPWTRVHLRAAMVDTLGRLLWSGTGTETIEGQNHEAVAPADGRTEASPGRSEFASGVGGPPPYRDVLDKLLTRWAAAFPQRATAPASGP